MDESTRQATRMWALAQPAVSAFITSIVRDFRDRDDVLQEVAVAVIESFPNYDPKRPFLAWAIRIAKNQVGNYFRKRRRSRVVFDAEAIEHLAVAFEEVSTNTRDQLEYLQDCLETLEGRSREMCLLRYQDDMKPAAIASRINMSANTVSKTLQRIREHLKACIEQKLALERHRP